MVCGWFAGVWRVPEGARLGKGHFRNFFWLFEPGAPGGDLGFWGVLYVYKYEESALRPILGRLGPKLWTHKEAPSAPFTPTKVYLSHFRSLFFCERRFAKMSPFAEKRAAKGRLSQQNCENVPAKTYLSQQIEGFLQICRAYFGQQLGALRGSSWMNKVLCQHECHHTIQGLCKKGPKGSQFLGGKRLSGAFHTRYIVILGSK